MVCAICGGAQMFNLGFFAWVSGTEFRLALYKASVIPPLRVFYFFFIQLTAIKCHVATRNFHNISKREP